MNVAEYLFGNGLIKCKNCGGRFRGKKQREKVVYVCSTYNKASSKCSPRVTLAQEDLEYTIRKHMDINCIKIELELSYYVKSINVHGKGYTVIYKDGSTSIINPNDDFGVKIKY
jgi:RecJ-like exonuclease